MVNINYVLLNYATHFIGIAIESTIRLCKVLCALPKKFNDFGDKVRKSVMKVE